MLRTARSNPTDGPGRLEPHPHNLWAGAPKKNRMDVVQKTAMGLFEPGEGGERYYLSPHAKVILRQSLREALLGPEAEPEIGALLRLIQGLATELRSPKTAQVLVEMIRETPLALAMVRERFSAHGTDPQRWPLMQADLPTATAKVLIAPRAPPPPPPASLDEVGLESTEDHPTREITARSAVVGAQDATILDLPTRPPRLDYSVLTQPELRAVSARVERPSTPGR